MIKSVVPSVTTPIILATCSSQALYKTKVRKPFTSYTH